MNSQIRPTTISRLVLCSADASPTSQRNEQDKAKYFFPDGRWVGAVRNVSYDLGCRFVILTTAYGLVNPNDLLMRYDKHIDEYRDYISEKWHQTVPRVLGAHEYDMMIFYAGGCPRDKYFEVLWPILFSMGIALIAFGKPNMGDAGKLKQVTKMIINGTSVSDLQSILKYPERLEYYSMS